MDILFESEKDRQLYTSQKLLQSKHGRLAKPITTRLDQLKASENLGVYMAMRLGNPHFLDAEYKGCIGVSLSPNYRLIFRPVYETDMDFSNLDLSALCVITIMEVTDYHGR